MGNQQVKTSQDATESTLQMLCSLTEMSYNSPNVFDFNPFCANSQTSKREIVSQNHMNQDEVVISMTIDGSNEIYTSEKGMEQKQKHSANMEQNQQQERNQGMDLSYLGKTKKIQRNLNKAEKKPRHRQLSIFNCSESVKKSQNQIINEQNIRDQNNCKSYHKLVKNYLLLNKLGYLIEPFQSKYHTRYYFIIALLMIKHHVNENWISCYKQIVMEELSIQERKIERKYIQINKLQIRIRELEARKLDVSVMLAKKVKLERQIGHIEVIKHEIENYSLRACVAFFSNNLEESLRILYLKDDPVMRKRSYFQQAVSIVKDIQRKIQTQKSSK